MINSPQEIALKIKSGDKMILSQAITLLESTLPNHQELAQEILAALPPAQKATMRIAITGPPGVGKSTFIDVLGTYFIARQHRVAILAIDPSSKISGGSILGDKTRMNQLLAQEAAFIRPSPAGNTLGGILTSTQDTILLCEAAGYDVILVETVGVGQSETMAKNITDMFLLLTFTGAGDELQGIKRGIMEMADLIIIHKVEHENRKMAEVAANQIQQALHYFSIPESDFSPKVALCSSVTKEGVEEVANGIQSYFSKIHGNGFFQKNRNAQKIATFEEAFKSQLYHWILAQPNLHEEWNQLKLKVSAGKMNAGKATLLFFDFLKSKLKL